MDPEAGFPTGVQTSHVLRRDRTSDMGPDLWLEFVNLRDTAAENAAKGSDIRQVDESLYIHN